MTLAGFIRTHHLEIIAEFEEFARTLMPPGANMTPVELRDHAEELLTAVVEDMGTIQSDGEQTRKSRGLGTQRSMASSGILHADARIQHGFTPVALLAEFRALRASVLRLYERVGEGADLEGIRRFNESIDEALAASMMQYGAVTDMYRDQFMGVLGHDLRGPLNAITSGAALMTMSSDSDQRQARIGSLILRSAGRMDRMIRDLLDLTRVRLGGAIPLERTRTDLAKVCQEVLLEVQTAHAAAVVRFDEAGDLTGEWDSDRLSQVLANLVGNAVQHGDGALVRVSAHGHEKHVVLTVHNSGTPIVSDAHRSVFEPLVRGPVTDGRGNSSIGLGLFIARVIVESHGGEIGFSSTQADGTAFTVCLPRSQPPVNIVRPAGPDFAEPLQV
jgi:signal transduction histidine kinase